MRPYSFTLKTSTNELAIPGLQLTGEIALETPDDPTARQNKLIGEKRTIIKHPPQTIMSQHRSE